jgi:hypothetical protein
MGYDSTTARMIELYMEDASAPFFLSGFFRSPPENFHRSEEVTIDIERDGEDIAIPIKNLGTGARQNESSVYTNKAFIPPVFDEEGTISAYKLLERQPGQHTFRDPEFGIAAARQAFNVFRKLEKKIRRSVEVMSSQTLQDGAVILLDKSGAQAFALDFQQSADLRPTAGNDWGGMGETPLADLENLAQVIRRRGKHQPAKLVFGKRAWRDFLDNDDVQKKLDNRRMELGTIAPETRGQGATFQGWVWIGHYRFECWTYDGFYIHPQTEAVVPYVGDDRVIMLSEGARLDLTYGAVPMLRRPDAGPLSFLPPRMSGEDAGIDFSTNAYFSPDGRHLMVGAATRPLTIPTAIDTFGCLRTRA